MLYDCKTFHESSSVLICSKLVNAQMSTKLALVVKRNEKKCVTIEPLEIERRREIMEEGCFKEYGKQEMNRSFGAN